MRSKPPDRRMQRSGWRIGIVVLVLMASQSAQALTLEFSGPATLTASRQEALTSYRLPVGPWIGTGVEKLLIEGSLDQATWRITAPGETTLALMLPLRSQIARDGWQVIFECETEACGGFDFRYGIDVQPEPDMHVDLGDFRYLAAERGEGADKEYLGLLLSRSAVSGFVQLTRLGASLPVDAIQEVGGQPGATQPDNAVGSPAALPAAATDLATRLETEGAVALDDLVFPSGTAALVEGEYASLVALADYLRTNPERSVVLVGHTDAAGSLEANIALSRRRANAVRERLITRHGLPAAQITADGVGFLAPRASNLTEEGRTQNRRVEVMLTSTN